MSFSCPCRNAGMLAFECFYLQDTALCRAFPENGLNAFRDGKSIAVQSFKARDQMSYPFAFSWRRTELIAQSNYSLHLPDTMSCVTGLPGRREAQEAFELDAEILVGDRRRVFFCSRCSIDPTAIVSACSLPFATCCASRIAFSCTCEDLQAEIKIQVAPHAPRGFPSAIDDHLCAPSFPITVSFSLSLSLSLSLLHLLAPSFSITVYKPQTLRFPSSVVPSLNFAQACST
jgi:hypothetical protein